MSSQTVFITKATTNVTVYVDLIQDNSGSNPGDPLTGLVYNSASLVCYYVRPLAAAAALSLATQTVTGAHSDGGFVEVDATNMPGKYRLDLSDAICATGVNYAAVTLAGYADLAAHTVHIVLTDVDLYSGTDAGLSSLAAVLVDTGTTIPALLPTALVSGRMNCNVAALGDDTTALANLVAGALGLETGSVSGSSSTTTTVDTNLSEITADHYNGAVIVFTSGNLAGQRSSISDYDGAGTLTVVALTEAPGNGDTFVIA